jgi:hypothetical protein
MAVSFAVYRADRAYRPRHAAPGSFLRSLFFLDVPASADQAVRMRAAPTPTSTVAAGPERVPAWVRHRDRE